jgi:hypothetical protein
VTSAQTGYGPALARFDRITPQFHELLLRSDQQAFEGTSPAATPTEVIGLPEREWPPMNANERRLENQGKISAFIGVHRRLKSAFQHPAWDSQMQPW